MSVTTTTNTNMTEDIEVLDEWIRDYITYKKVK